MASNVPIFIKAFGKFVEIYHEVDFKLVYPSVHCAYYLIYNSLKRRLFDVFDVSIKSFFFAKKIQKAAANSF